MVRIGIESNKSRWSMFGRCESLCPFDYSTLIPEENIHERYTGTIFQFTPCYLDQNALTTRSGYHANRWMECLLNVQWAPYLTDSIKCFSIGLNTQGSECRKRENILLLLRPLFLEQRFNYDLMILMWYIV